MDSNNNSVNRDNESKIVSSIFDGLYVRHQQKEENQENTNDIEKNPQEIIIDHKEVALDSPLSVADNKPNQEFIDDRLVDVQSKPSDSRKSITENNEVFSRVNSTDMLDAALIPPLINFNDTQNQGTFQPGNSPIGSTGQNDNGNALQPRYNITFNSEYVENQNDDIDDKAVSKHSQGQSSQNTIQKDASQFLADKKEQIIQNQNDDTLYKTVSKNSKDWGSKKSIEHNTNEKDANQFLADKKEQIIENFDELGGLLELSVNNVVSDIMDDSKVFDNLVKGCEDDQISAIIEEEGVLDGANEDKKFEDLIVCKYPNASLNYKRERAMYVRMNQKINIKVADNRDDEELNQKFKKSDNSPTKTIFGMIIKEVMGGNPINEEDEFLNPLDIESPENSKKFNKDSEPYITLAERRQDQIFVDGVLRSRQYTPEPIKEAFLELPEPKCKYKISDLEEYFGNDQVDRSDECSEPFLNLLKNLTFFENSYQKLVQNSIDTDTEYPTNKSFLQSCQYYLKIEKYIQGDAIFHHREAGDKLYVILKGDCGVYLPRPDSEIAADKLKFKKAFNRKQDQILESVINEKKHLDARDIYNRKSEMESYGKRSLKECYNMVEFILPKNALEKQKKYEDNEDIKYLLYNFHKLDYCNQNDLLTLCCDQFNKYFDKGGFTYKMVATLDQGRCVGDLAQINNDPRSASILCMTDCTVLTLSKNDYKSIFATTIDKEQQKALFFENLFTEWDKSLLVPFAYNFKEKRLSRGSVLYNEGQKIRYVYLVKEGEVGQYKKFASNSNKHKYEEFWDLAPKNMEWKSKHKFLNTVLAGNFVGEGDLLNRIQARSHSAVANTYPTIVYFCDQKNFMQSEKYLKHHFKLFRESVKLKWKFRHQRLDIIEKEELKNKSAKEEVTIGEITENNFKLAEKLGTKDMFVENSKDKIIESTKIGLALQYKRQAFMQDNKWVAHPKVDLDPRPDETINYIAQVKTRSPMRQLYIDKHMNDDTDDPDENQRHKRKYHLNNNNNKNPGIYSDKKVFGLSQKHKNYLNEVEHVDVVNQFTELVNKQKARRDPLNGTIKNESGYGSIDGKNGSYYRGGSSDINGGMNEPDTDRVVFQTNNNGAVANYHNHIINSRNVPINPSGRTFVTNIQIDGNVMQNYDCSRFVRAPTKGFGYKIDKMNRSKGSLDQNTTRDDGLFEPWNTVNQEDNDILQDEPPNKEGSLVRSDAYINSKDKGNSSHNNIIYGIKANDSVNIGQFQANDQRSENYSKDQTEKIMSSPINDNYGTYYNQIIPSDHKMYPQFQPNFRAGNATNEKYKNFMEFKDNLKLAPLNQNKEGYLDNNTDFRNQHLSHTKPNMNPYIRTPLIRTRPKNKNQEKMEIVRYSIPQSQYRGIPVFNQTQKDKTKQKSQHSGAYYRSRSVCDQDDPNATYAIPENTYKFNSLSQYDDHNRLAPIDVVRGDMSADRNRLVPIDMARGDMSADRALYINKRNMKHMPKQICGFNKEKIDYINCGSLRKGVAPRLDKKSGYDGRDKGVRYGRPTMNDLSNLNCTAICFGVGSPKNVRNGFDRNYGNSGII